MAWLESALLCGRLALSAPPFAYSLLSASERCDRLRSDLDFGRCDPLRRTSLCGTGEPLL